MKRALGKILCGATLLLGLPLTFTGCDEILGEWSKPVVVQTPPSTVVAEAKVLGAALEAGATVSISYTVGSTTYVATFVKNADDSYTLQSNVKPSATRALTRTAAADPVVSVGDGAAVGDQVQLVLVGGKLKLVVKAANDDPLFEATMDIETGQIAIFNTNARGVNCGIGSFAVNGSPMAIKNPEMQLVKVQFTQTMIDPGSSISLSLVFNYTVQYLNGETWANVIARYKASDHGEISTTDDGFISITFRQDIAAEVVKTAVSQLDADKAVQMTPDKQSEMATTVSQTKYYLYTTVPVKSTDVIDGSHQDYGLSVDAPVTYKKGAWDDATKKVVFTNEIAIAKVVQNASASVSWSDGWYTVSGDVTINGDVYLGADTHLILQDGAKLTINGQLDCSAKNLYIYGQKKGDGKLNVTNNSATAINSNNRIDIHGGEITAAATGSDNIGLYTGYLAVYGGKLTVTSSTSSGAAIKFNNSGFKVYGGEVIAEATNTVSSQSAYGIQGSGVLTVYGGKVHAAGNGVIHNANYGQAIYATCVSGTESIKFYFSDDNTSWNTGLYYSSSSAALTSRYAKAE